MTSSALIRSLVVSATLVPATVVAGPLLRFTLVVGANNGGTDRPRLQYAVSDAERFARVMVELGGVDPENEIVLKDPKVGELLAALDRLSAKIAGKRRGPGAQTSRTELFLYYSGHADEKGLLLGEDRLSYVTLRDRLDEMPSDVRIAVLDACASGAFTRLKGGRARPPFLVDESSSMRGHAFLTSSAATESAQESDRIRASFFTHYLVSGFRGAADMSGDGKVTLNEAYQFAFAETLGRTVDTKGGAQHPSYDINLSGAGDVVITDVRQTTARLILGEELEGRFFIRTTTQGLVVELNKPRGRRVEIGLEPGSYEVRVERDRTALVATTTLADGATVMLDAGRFGAAALAPTQRRGDSDLSPFAVAGRNQLTLETGVWGDHGSTIHIGNHGFDVLGQLSYTRYLREDLALAVGVAGFGAEAAVDLVGGLAFPLDLRWNPRPGQRAQQAVKPFLSVGLVPVSSADYGTTRRNAIGARVGAGVNLHLGHTTTLGLGVNYNAVPELHRPSGLHDNFSGIQMSTWVGFMFGKAR